MNLQEEFKNYLIENFGLDKKEWLLSQVPSYIKTLDKAMLSVIEPMLADDPYMLILMTEKLGFSFEKQEEIIMEHIKIFNLDEYAKQHIERMV